MPFKKILVLILFIVCFSFTNAFADDAARDGRDACGSEKGWNYEPASDGQYYCFNSKQMISCPGNGSTNDGVNCTQAINCRKQVGESAAGVAKGSSGWACQHQRPAVKNKTLTTETALCENAYAPAANCSAMACQCTAKATPVCGIGRAQKSTRSQRWGCAKASAYGGGK
jgi:hypothetical protein